MKRLSLILPLLLLVSWASSPMAQGQSDLRTIPGSYFVQLEEGTNDTELRRSVRQLDLDLKHAYQFAPGRFNVRGVGASALAQLRRLPGLLEITPDYEVRAALGTSVPLVGALADDPDMAGTDGGDGIRICVLDTGINPDHIMFDTNPPGGPSRIAAWRDFVGGQANPYDDNGHGSHVAGIVAGRTGLTLDGAPFQGIAPQATLYVGKVLDSAGNGSFSDIHAAIDWCSGIGGGAASPPAQIISMSLGGGSFGTACDNNDPTGTAPFVNAAAAAGVLVISASGNESNSNSVLTPACASGSMAIGATYDADVGRKFFQGCRDRKTKTDKICCFSNQWDFLDVVAPGCDSMSASHTSATGVASFCGTSQATPHVAGLAALVMAKNPTMSAADVRSRINTTAMDLGDPGPDRAFGHGRVEAGAAVNGPPACESTETSCSDGVDNDCDGLTDCADPECDGAPECQDMDCTPLGDGCVTDEECCTLKCKGKSGGKTCK